MARDPIRILTLLGNRCSFLGGELFQVCDANTSFNLCHPCDHFFEAIIADGIEFMRWHDVAQLREDVGVLASRMGPIHKIKACIAAMLWGAVVAIFAAARRVLQQFIGQPAAGLMLL